MGTVVNMDKELSARLNKVRSAQRITGQQIIQRLFTEIVEMHGDRVNSDDPAVWAGIGLFEEQPVTFLSVDRGQDLTERLAKNGGAVRAGGYRKALRNVELAQRFDRPVVSFLNMPGADASVDSENEGQSLMIANLMETMGALRVPNLAVIVGEGHSGGALAFANANQLWMLENGLFSVAAPEAMAAILRDDRALARVPMTVSQLQQIGIADQVFKEGPQLTENLRKALRQWLATSRKMDENELVMQREQKFQQVLRDWFAD